MESVKQIRAAAIGFSCMDVYEKLDKCYPTGNGVDWGVHLSRMGIPVSVVSVTGDDEYGKIMRNMLEKEGMDISHLHEAHGETCQMKMDLVDEVEKIYLEEVEGVMKDFSLTEEDREFIKTFDYVHTDLFGYVLEDLAEIRASGAKVILDYSVYSDDPEYNSPENYKNTDYAFLSYDKEDDYILEHMKTIYSYGPRIVTVTLGDKGSISYDGEQYYHYGIVPVDAVNTVGAGDSYIAGFTYGIIQGWDIPKCQKLGAELSAEVVMKFEPY